MAGLGSSETRAFNIDSAQVLSTFWPDYILYKQYTPGQAFPLLQGSRIMTEPENALALMS
jgi:hypothetical protein